MTQSKTIVVIFLMVLFCCPTQAQEKIKLEGVWELVAAKFDGKEAPISGRQIKLLTKNHFVWVHQDKKNVLDLLAKKTELDSLRAYINGFGAGTYTIAGATYTESIELFTEPDYIGHSIDFSCKLEGGRWLHSGKLPLFEGGKKVRDVLLEETWKRIE